MCITILNLVYRQFACIQYTPLGFLWFSQWNLFRWNFHRKVRCTLFESSLSNKSFPPWTDNRRNSVRGRCKGHATIFVQSFRALGQKKKRREMTNNCIVSSCHNCNIFSTKFFYNNLSYFCQLSHAFSRNRNNRNHYIRLIYCVYCVCVIIYIVYGKYFDSEFSEGQNCHFKIRI